MQGVGTVIAVSSMAVPAANLILGPLGLAIAGAGLMSLALDTIHQEEALELLQRVRRYKDLVTRRAFGPEDRNPD